MVRSLPLTSFCQWQLKPPAPGTSRADPRNWYRRITAVTEDTRETVFLFQRLSIALQRGNAVAFLATFDAVWYPSWSLFLLSLIFTPVALCLLFINHKSLSTIRATLSIESTSWFISPDSLGTDPVSLTFIAQGLCSRIDAASLPPPVRSWFTGRLSLSLFITNFMLKLLFRPSWKFYQRCTPGHPTDGGPPWRGGGAYGLRGSCRFRFLGIQRGGDY